jgi:hypothetical protein
MLADYWWVFILIIFVIMLITPNKVEKMKNTKKYKNKELNLNPNLILKNINKITGYYVGVS